MLWNLSSYKFREGFANANILIIHSYNMLPTANHDLDPKCPSLWSPSQDSSSSLYHSASVISRIFKTLILTHACGSFGWCKHTVITWVYERAVRAIRSTFEMPQQWRDKIKQTLEHHAIRCELVYTIEVQGQASSTSVPNHETAGPPSHAWAKWRNRRKNKASKARPPFAKTS